ncbi:hypothetical protein [Winogradskyella luteola]|uniref:Uncharacterized protein n=1 Tax=Winogradskyella luteola TaxID=2828330 RepID=A0A9X1FC81_9FLAO|nr:hypothetical protein [Winogradskyella luteola]MBV7270418.1 hypothetical protein [Winogradskyella luteola]
MKSLLIKSLFILFTFNLSFSQAWMTNLDIAQKLAMVENKMVLMVWEGTTEYTYPVFVNDDKGRTVFIENLFTDEYISPLIWKYFIPVIVSENKYGSMYYEIKGKRSQKYIDKFNDNSIKIMDINGNILNASDVYLEDLENITKIIQKYGLNTEFIAPKLKGYYNEKTFFSAYYLASKYMDYTMYINKNQRKDLIDLSTIYLKEARLLTKTEPKEDQAVLQQRCDLLEIQQLLLLKRPRRVLRLLKRMDAEDINNTNTAFMAFLFYTVHMSLGDNDKAEIWKSKISSVDLKKAQKLINLNS